MAEERKTICPIWYLKECRCHGDYHCTPRGITNLLDDPKVVRDEAKEFDVVLRHGPCWDGAAAAYVVSKYHNNINKSKPDWVSLSPRDAFPEELYEQLVDKRVIMLDIAFDRDTMLKLERICSKFLVLDHHKTNQEALEGLDFEGFGGARFDMSKSACMMAWEYFYPEREIPRFLVYIGLRDIWKHEDNEDALYFTTALYNSNMSQTYGMIQGFDQDVSVIGDSLVEEFISTGQHQYKTKMGIVKDVAKRAVDIEWKEYKLCIINAGWPLASDVGALLYGDRVNSIIVLWTKKFGEDYNYSLRSHKLGPDVEDFAKLFNGGGHAHSGGFKDPLSPDQLFEIN